MTISWEELWGWEQQMAKQKVYNACLLDIHLTIRERNLFQLWYVLIREYVIWLDYYNHLDKWDSLQKKYRSWLKRKHIDAPWLTWFQQLETHVHLNLLVDVLERQSAPPAVVDLDVLLYRENLASLPPNAGEYLRNANQHQQQTYSGMPFSPPSSQNQEPDMGEQLWRQAIKDDMKKDIMRPTFLDQFNSSMRNEEPAWKKYR